MITGFGTERCAITLGLYCCLLLLFLKLFVVVFNWFGLLIVTIMFCVFASAFQGGWSLGRDGKVV